MNDKKKAKQIVIISGKGGTGKTSITASFAALSRDSVLADCDVDAADLHLVASPRRIAVNSFISGNEAVISPDICTGCGRCSDLCRFEAVSRDESTGKYFVLPVSCEGCGVCVDNCPAGAIDFPQRRCGEWMISETKYGTMVHSRLDAGAENSGKLVTLVRNEAVNAAEKESADLILIDGPPGIGCPVIASLTGTDYILAVTEPTMSGRHDLMRVLDLAGHFKIPVFVCINKWDINPEITKDIEKLSAEKNAEILGRIPYDMNITLAQIKGISAVEITDSIAAKEITAIWKKLKQKIL
ncbi:MAG: ATP-binding protein [Spirochaetales bacterium]|nr:ATP-binding protein [Spirochaetales bacterium]